MFKSIVLRLPFCAVLSILPLVSTGQEPGAQRRNITVDDSRPLYEAIKQLRGRYGWLISYQDPPYENPDDLMPREGAPVKHMVPRRRRVSVGYTEPKDGTAEERKRVIGQVVDAFGAAGAGQFRVYHSGAFSHVVPISVRRASGRLEDVPSMCEMAVSLPPATRTIDESVSLILQQISQQSRVTIARGADPRNLFVGNSYPSEAENERACDLLVRTTEAANLTRVGLGLPLVHVVWGLLYDPTAKEYFFNAAIVEPPQSPPPGLLGEPRRIDK